MQKRGMVTGITLMLLAGCSHPATVVGTWTGTRSTPQGVSETSTMTFTSDGKLTQSSDIVRGRQTYHLVGSGVYTANGNQLAQTMNTITINGRSMPIPADHTNTEHDTFQLNGNTMTLTDPQHHTQTLTRQGA